MRIHGVENWDPKEGRGRERWTNRIAFYFAAIGAAVGFGNVWRFPALSYEYGGGAFFIPYLLALFLVGIPLAVLEVGMGQFFQTGDVGVFGGFHRRFRGVGVSSVACGFMLVTYYSMLIAWSVHAFFDSFSKDSVWYQEGIDGATAVKYFQNDIIGTATLPEDGTPTRIVGANAGYSLLVWFVIFMGIGFGVRWTGRITYITMGLPIILLFVFLIRACTLEGARDGIKAIYVQIFFSIGVTFGILTALASYTPRNEPAACNSRVIALSNSTFSFISGFAVFASLGYASYISGIPIEDLGYGGFSLMFGTWPVVLSTLPGGIHWVRLLFFDLFLLGIDSAFAFVEANMTVVRDTNKFHRTPKWKATLGACIIGYCFSLIYATDAGLNFLDVVDFYINFVMLIVGFFECFAAGWIYGWKDQIETLGKGAIASQLIANFGSVSLACGLWFGLDSVWGGFVGLILFYLAGMGVACHFLKQKMEEVPGKWTWKTILWELLFGNIFALRDRIVPVIQNIPAMWCILMKQFLPHILLILFVNLAQSETATGETVFGSYGGYVTRPFQVLGILTFVFAATLFVVGLLFPVVYEPLRLPDDHFALDPEGEEVKRSLKEVEDATPAEQAPAEQAPEAAPKEATLDEAETGASLVKEESLSYHT